MPRATSLVLLVLSGCAGYGLREGEQGWSSHTRQTFALDVAVGRIFETTVTTAEGERRFGLVDAAKRRLLEPEWCELRTEHDPCIYARRAPGDPLTRHVLAGEAPELARSEETPYVEVVPVVTPPDRQAPPPGVPTFALPVHLASRVPTGQERHEVDLLDASGRRLATIPGWHGTSRALVHGNTVVVTQPGEVASTVLVGPDGAVSAPLPRLLWLVYQIDPFGSGGPRHTVLAFETGKTSPRGQPLHWPLDATTGLPRVDASGTISGFELVGVTPRSGPGIVKAWIVHSSADDGPRAGLEVPGGAIDTGPRWRSLEPTMVVGIDGTAFLAEALDGAWTCVNIDTAARLEELFAERLALREAVLEQIATRVAELARLRAESERRAAEDRAAEARRQAEARARDEAVLAAHLAHGAAGAGDPEQDLAAALAASRLGHAAELRLLRHRWEHVPGRRSSLAQSLGWFSRFPEGDPRLAADDAAWARSTYAALVSRLRAAQLAAEEAEQARHEEERRRAGELEARQAAQAERARDAANAAYMRQSAETQRYVQALDAYTRGRQDWYYGR